MGLASSSPWLKYYGNAPASLDYPHATMYQLVAQAAKRKPNNTAYVFMGKKTSYQEFMQRIEAAAKGLYKMGIRKGDRVTICMANTPQALDCFYALNRIGAVPNMIHPLSAAQEIAFYLNFSKSKAILTLDQFYYKVAEILPQLETPCKILIAKVADELPAPLSLLYPMTKGARAIKKLPKTGYTLWYKMVAAGRNQVLPADDGTYDECGAILYSGGTTGTTKGILLSNLNFNALALQTIAASGYNVYPSQLENIIDGHEKVLLSCIIGVKDPYRVQRVKAYVVPMPGVEPTEELKEELLNYCSKHIAKYAMPREIEFRKELPKTLVGKVAYRVLEEEANAAMGNNG